MIWISRDALTRGIYEVNARIIEDCGPYNGMANTDPKDKYTPGDLFYPGEWHRTREEAVKAAEGMRDAAIAKHQLRINLLKGLTF